MTIAIESPAFAARLADADIPPTRPEIDVDAISIPAGEYTGDFYTAVGVGDDLWFAVGDVSGKGLGAALIMSLIQEQLELLIDTPESTDPADVVARLDRAIRGEIPGNRFATLVVGRIDSQHRLDIVNAGHCEPFVLRANGEMVSISSTGPIVGLLPRATWNQRTIDLGAGDRLVVYTDGLLEAESHEGEEFGIDRVRHALAEACRKGFIEEVLATVDEFSEGRQHDDLTLFSLTVRR